MSVASAFDNAAEGVTRALDRMRTYDRPLLIIAAILLGLGIVLAMAASPVATQRFDIEQAFYFALRQAGYALAGVAVIFITAGLDPRGLRRLSVILVSIMLPLSALAGLFAPEVKGASRWFDLGPMSLQPSEILKPALVIFWAWMMSEQMQRRSFPGRPIALGTYALTAAALLTQPDIGQCVLLLIVLVVMSMLSGMNWRWLAAFGAATVAAGFAIYNFYGHARVRIDDFIAAADGEPGYQVGRALDAIASGGVFGRGPGEGVIKRLLPDAHADFVYAVGAEEFGLFASLGLIAIFGALAFRGLSRAARLNDAFAQLAAAGLISLLVAQASIHIAVNLSLLPAKGMTLPFISFGGSSMIGAAIAFGAAISLLRNRPGAFLFAQRA